VIADTLRRPIFLLGVGLFGLAWLLELGSEPAMRFLVWLGPGKGELHGYAILSLALLDALIMLALVTMAISLLAPEWFLGLARLIANLVVSICVLFISFIAAFAALGLIILLVTLLFAPIFGTIAYFAIYVPFAIGETTALLSLLMLLKLGSAIALVVSQPRFLDSKGLVLILLCSLGCVLLTSFLYAFVPGFLVPIVDAVAALIIAIVALIWAVIYLIGSVVAIVRAIA
jgi:hypothetical protein